MTDGSGDTPAKAVFGYLTLPLMVVCAGLVIWAILHFFSPRNAPEKLLTIDGCDIFSFVVKGNTHYFAKCGNGTVAVTNGETGEILITKTLAEGG